MRRCRIVLIVNPYSTGVTRRRVADVTAALARHAEVVVRQTERRGHATELAGEAVGRPTPSSSSRATAPTTRRSTAPPASCRSGSCRAAARVSSRARSACRATPSLAAVQASTRSRAGRTTSIGLGRVNGRRFCFSAGIGFDAEAVRRIDRRGRDRDGRRAGNASFAATVVGIVLEKPLPDAAAARDRGLRSGRVPLRRKRPALHLRGPVPDHDRGRRRLRRRPRLRRAARDPAGSVPRPRPARVPRDAPAIRACSPATTSTASTSAATGRCRSRPTARTSATSPRRGSRPSETRSRVLL